MTLDATFWVTVSFFIFVGILIYFKIPQKIKVLLDENIEIRDGLRTRKVRLINEAYDRVRNNFED